jgi:DNA polymerase phi
MAPGPLLPEMMKIAAMERVGGGDDVVSGTNSANQSLTPVGMQIYWNLSSMNMTVREAAALALVRELREKQEEFTAGGGRGGIAEVLGAKDNDGLFDGCAPAVQYALRRLVRGLGSSRECARQGFSTALTAVVEALPVLRGEALLRVIPSNLEVTSSMKKQDARDGLLGRLFAYGSLIRAKRIIGDGTSSEEKGLANEIVEHLFTLAKQKTFLREPAVTLLIELASRLPSSAVTETVCASPMFDELLRKDVESQSAEALLLVLRLHDKLPAQSSPLVPESGNLQDLFEPSHLAKLIPCLKESSSAHPRVHAVWDHLLDLLFAPTNSHTQAAVKTNRAKSVKDAKDLKRIETNLTNFWSVVVDGALLTSSHERKNLAMELLLLVLPRLPNPESVGIVLSNLFVRFILNILSSKATLLHKSAKRCLSELCVWAEVSTHRQAAVIVALQKHSYGNFDAVSKTFTVRALTKGMTTEDGVLAFVHNLTEMFVAAEPSVSEEPEDAAANGTDKAGANERIWIVEQMFTLCKEVEVEPKTAQGSLFKEVIKFFIAQALFEANDQQNGGHAENEYRLPKKTLPEDLRKIIADRLHSIIVIADRWIAAEKSRSNSAGSTEKTETVDEDFTHFAASICLSIQKSTNAVHVQPLKEEAAESVKILQQTVSILSSAVKSEENVDKRSRLVALRSLLSLLLLESFVEPGSTDDIAAELAICCSKAFPELPELSNIAPPVAVEGSEAPPVMDVLLDVLLSQLAKSSHPIREAVEKVFKVYCEDLTSAGMTDCLRILKKGSKSGRHKSMIEDGEDDTDDDDDILEDDEDGELEGDGEKSVQPKQDGETEDDDEDDDEDEDVEMGDGDGEARTLTEQMRFKRSAEDMDEEAEGSDSDVSDMDDEAMFRADVLLANVLKQKKLASKGNAQLELMNFKLRVLSLLEIFLHKHPSSSLVVLGVSGLLKAFVISVNQLGTAPEGNEVLVKRFETLLRGVFNHKKSPPKRNDVDLVQTRQLLQQSWKLAAKSSIKRVASLAQDCVLWTLRILVGNVNEGDAEVSEFLTKSVEDFFTNHHSRLKGLFWSQIFRQHPVLARACIGKLIEKVGNGRNITLRCEGMRLVTEILKPVTSPKGGKKAAAGEGETAKLFVEALEGHVDSLGAVILSTVQDFPKKRDHKLLALPFCISSIDALRLLFPHKSLDREALLVGLKAIQAPNQGKIQTFLSKLKETVANLKPDDNNNSTPSKKQKANDEVVAMEVEKEATPSKKKKGKRAEAVVEVATPSAKSKKKAKTSETVQVETMQVQAEETPKKEPSTSAMKAKKARQNYE